MKKFFYLMVMVCTLGFFTACSSDDDPTIWDTYKGGDYEVWFDGVLETSDDARNNVYDLNMNISKVDDTKAKITITSKDAKNAFGPIVIPEAFIELKGEDIVVSGSLGSTSVKATIGSDKKVSVEIKEDQNVYNADNYGEAATNDLIGSWDTFVQWYNEDGKIDTPTGEGGDEYALGSVKLNWEAEEGTQLYIMEGFGMPVESARALAERSANAQFTSVLKSVSFTSDGKIIAVYSDSDDNTKPTWKVAKDYATYKIIADNLLEVHLNNDLILSSVADKGTEEEKATLKTILDIFNDGIPVNIRYSNDNKTAFFYVDKDFAAELANNVVLKGLVENIQDDDLDGMGAMIKFIAGQIPSLMEKTTKFEAGIELNKH